MKYDSMLPSLAFLAWPPSNGPRRQLGRSEDKSPKKDRDESGSLTLSRDVIA